MAHNDFSGKVALVVGGASGIGQAICHELSNRSATVIVADLMCKDENELMAIPVDVSERRAVDEMVSRAIQLHERIDYLFNCAGVGWSGGFETMDPQTADRVIAINYIGIMNTTNAVYGEMVRQRTGHIVNLASVDGLMPRPFRAVYSGTKHAIVGFSLALRGEARSHGVDVSVVCTGRIKTNIDANSSAILTQDKKPPMESSSSPNPHALACARKILRGVGRRQSIIAFSFFRPIWWTYRFSPALCMRLVYPLITRRLGKTEPSKIARGYASAVSALAKTIRKLKP